LVQFYKSFVLLYQLLKSCNLIHFCYHLSYKLMNVNLFFLYGKTHNICYRQMISKVCKKIASPFWFKFGGKSFLTQVTQKIKFVQVPQLLLNRCDISFILNFYSYLARIKSKVTIIFPYYSILYSFEYINRLSSV